MTNEADKSLALMQGALREAMIAEGIDEACVVKELKKLLTGDSITGKSKAIEIVSKWSNWNKETVVSKETIEIVGKPEGLDI
jgi:hypothetical protein